MFFALAVSIFGWGLQYKLSLYEPHMVTHAIPEAKLLSRDESEAQGGGNSIERQDPLPSPHVVVYVAALLFSAVLVLLVLGNQPRNARELGRPWLRISRSGLNALFFRPPPIPA